MKIQKNKLLHFKLHQGLLLETKLSFHRCRNTGLLIANNKTNRLTALPQPHPKKGFAQKSMIRPTSFEEKTRTIFFYGIVFLLTSIFFIPEKSLHLKLFILFITISFPLMLYKGICRWQIIYESRIFLFSSLFLAYSLLSLFWSAPERSSDILHPIKNTFYLVSFWFIFIFAFDSANNRLQFLIKWLIIISCITAAAYACYQYLYLNYPLRQSRFLIPGPLLNEIRAGICLGAGALLCLASLLYKPTNRNITTTTLLLIALTIFLTTLVLTHTRWAIAGTLFFCFIMVALSQIETRNKVLLIGVGIVLLVIAGYFLAPLIDFYIKKGQSYRLILWSGFLNEYQDYWLGHGLGTKIYIREGVMANWHSFHSVYLGALISTGIIGLTLLLLMILTALTIGWKLRKDHYAFAATVLFAFGCAMGAVNFDSVILRPRGYWLPFWIPLMVLSLYELKLLRRKTTA